MGRTHVKKDLISESLHCPSFNRIAVWKKQLRYYKKYNSVCFFSTGMWTKMTQFRSRYKRKLKNYSKNHCENLYAAQLSFNAIKLYIQDCTLLQHTV